MAALALFARSCDEDDEEEEENENWADTSWSAPKESVAIESTLDNMGKLSSEEGNNIEGVENKEEPSSGDEGPSNSPQLMSRMKLNDNKAGMEGLDRDRINKIIYEASKGSRYYENEMKKEKQVTVKIEDQKLRLNSLNSEQLSSGEKEADKILQQLEDRRDLSRTIVHMDMDAFYAAVEMRDDPSLKNKPMAVGGNSMLSTSNYLARRFGVRAAMPGFIGKKLCPELVLVKANFEKYTAVSKEIREILAEYDPNFCPMSLDEAYLDFTDHLEKRQNWDDDQRSYFRKIPEDSSSCMCHKNNAKSIFTSETRSDYTEIEGNEIKDTILVDRCASCKKPLAHQVGEKETFGKSVEEAVREMRFRIQQKTALTASAGIAPNTMLAKVCSDKNKPNGQFRIQPARDEVMTFISELPIRKISGIGKVSERLLAALGVVKCKDIYAKRGALLHLYSQTSFNYFLRISLGISSTHLERDSERKSMSVERTFSEINKPAELFKKCYELCEALSEDLQDDKLTGKTVTLKLKTVAFEVKTRAHSLPNHTAQMKDIYSAARELLKTEIQAVTPQPLRLRLMGVRMSNFHQGNQGLDPKQASIKDLLSKLGAHGAHNNDHQNDKKTHISCPAVACVMEGTNSDQEIEVEDSNAAVEASIVTGHTNKNKSSPEPCAVEAKKSRPVIVPFGSIINSQECGHGPFRSRTSELPQSNDCGMELTSNSENLEEHKDKHSNLVISGDEAKCESSDHRTKSTMPANDDRKLETKVAPDTSNIDSCGTSEGVPSCSSDEVGPKIKVSSPARSRTGKTSQKKKSVVRDVGALELQTEEQVQYSCPVCGLVMPNRNLIMFNSHIDRCLVSQTGEERSSDNCEILLSSVSQVSQSCKSINRGTLLSATSSNSERTSCDIASKIVVDINSNTVMLETRDKPAALSPSSAGAICATSVHMSGKSAIEAAGRNVAVEQLPDEFVCPICNIEPSVTSLTEFNQHVDGCLTRRTIKEMLQQDEAKEVTPLKRSADTMSREVQPSTKRKRPAGIKPIDSFFK